jgi:uncharacterized protein YdiU (UPF0061 family)
MNAKKIESIAELAALRDYSLTGTLLPDPDASEDGVDHRSREVFSGHYVPVQPTPIENPRYVAHSRPLFRELGLSDTLAHTEAFKRIFSGDLSQAPAPMKRVGWATGYALSIYGTEYTRQCPFGSGNGYGDGRAISILEAVIDGRRWEMQLKGAGATPYCRGADGRAVLRSSVREFLAQEHMHALGVPTSRSLSLYVSETETVRRPWFTPGSRSVDPEVMIAEPVAIATRVASSFLRVGQIELFGRRARNHAHPGALEELERIVLHLIDREYSELADSGLSLSEKVLLLAEAFRERLASLVANWIRVGYCQGNFNSDNCAAGGFTLDYGPFGFIDLFDPKYQPWTGGGMHFSFFNQPEAARRNFLSFCSALRPLLRLDSEALKRLQEIEEGFAERMQTHMERMWAAKLGMDHYDVGLFGDLLKLMMPTGVDYTLFFRELSKIPNSVTGLQRSFYQPLSPGHELLERWDAWLERWRAKIDADTPESRYALSDRMKKVNPKYTLREWFLVPAYERAAQGDYSLIDELMEVMTDPYAEQSEEVEEKYYRLKPLEYFRVAGISHVSCSS